MQLTLKTEELGGAVLIRCQGRIVVGEEIRALQREVEDVPPPLLQGRKVILDLAAVSFIDSAGVGALVRLLGVLRAHGGELKLCRVSPFVAKVLEVTNLKGVLATKDRSLPRNRSNRRRPASCAPTIRTTCWPI